MLSAGEFHYYKLETYDYIFWYVYGKYLPKVWESVQSPQPIAATRL